MLVDIILFPFLIVYQATMAIYKFIKKAVVFIFKPFEKGLIKLFDGFSLIKSGIVSFFSSIGYFSIMFFTFIGDLVLNLLLFIPRKIGKQFKSSKVRQQFKKGTKRNEYILDINSLDAKRSDKKTVYKYIARDETGVLVKGTFEAYSKLDIHSFLSSEGYEIYDIRTSQWIDFYNKNNDKTKIKIKNKDLIFFLKQLATYIRAGVSLTKAIRILGKQFKNPTMKKIMQKLVYELTMGESFSTALLKQGDTFPKFLINMIKASELTGEITTILDELSEYYATIHKNRKQLIAALTYPTFVFVFAVIILGAVMMFIVPQFVEIYNTSDVPIPSFTQMTINASVFLQQYWWVIILVILGIILITIQSIKHVKSIRYAWHWFIMHIPVVKNVIIYNELTTFSKTFGTLLAHGVNIVESLTVLRNVSSNEIFKELMVNTVADIAKGNAISDTFKSHWAVPPITYYMLKTGEETGRPSEMLFQIADYYGNEQKSLVDQLKSLVEPIIIIFLAVAVGFIVLSIVIPMFSFYEGLDM